MNTEMRIKNGQEFESIIKSGLKIKNSYFIIYYKEKKLDNSRFGITFSKKFGNAVKRNRFKRITREIIRNNQKRFKNVHDYIIIIRKASDILNFTDYEKILIDLLLKETK